MRGYVLLTIIAAIFVANAAGGLSIFTKLFRNSKNCATAYQATGNCNGNSLHKPIGISNLRNTCYLNSVLQGVFSCVRLTSTQSPFFDLEPQSVGEELALMYRKYRNSSSIDTKILASSLGVDIRIQEDAEEFFLKLLNAVELSHATRKRETSQPSLSSLFESEIEQTIQCVHVDQVSVKNEKYFDFSVDMPTSAGTAKEVTLSNLLREFFRPEQLDMYKSLSHGYQQAVKSLVVSRLPRVLSVHLKRFSYDLNTNSMHKINTPVSIPLSLDMAVHTKEPAKPQMYDLNAVIVHEGDSVDFGHYFALIRPNPISAPDRWFKVSDHEVHTLTADEALSIARGGEKVDPSSVCNDNNNKNRDERGVCRPTGSSAYMVMYTKRMG